MPTNSEQDSLRQVFKAIFDDKNLKAARELLDEKHKLVLSDEKLDLTKSSGQQELWDSLQVWHLPQTLQRVLGHTKSQLPFTDAKENRKALLLMVGYSVEQLALSIATHEAQGVRIVVPFTTEQCWEDIKKVLSKTLLLLGITVSGTSIDESVYSDESSKSITIDEPQLVQESSLSDVFAKLIAWIRMNPKFAVAIDCTGGKKPMDSGATHAAAFLNVPVYYLDFQSYRVVQRRPEPWSCYYRRLDLPEVAFGLSSRLRVLAQFRSRDFENADQSLLAVRSALESYLKDDATTGSDPLQRIQPAAGAIARAKAFVSMGYEKEMFTEHPLHGVFKSACTESIGPRELIHKLFDRVHDEAANFAKTKKWPLIVEYIFDEYWRLQAMRKLKHYRDVHVACAGIVELILNAVFFLPRFAKAKYELMGREMTCDPRVMQRLSLGIRKAILTQEKGTYEFAVDKEVLPDGRLCERNGSWIPDEARIKVRVTHPNGAPVKLDANSQIWADFWGNLGSRDECPWFDLRNGIAHLRVPLFDTTEIDKAIDIYVPRFIEMLIRLIQHPDESVDITESGTETWLTWKIDSHWAEERRCGWTHAEEQIAKALELPSERVQA